MMMALRNKDWSRMLKILAWLLPFLKHLLKISIFQLDGIQAWYQIVNQYETDVNRNVRIKKVEVVITTVLNHHYKGGLFKLVQHAKDAFTEHLFLGQTTWNDDSIKKQGFVQNAQNVGMLDTILKYVIYTSLFS
jgi:hypothetical protein